MPEPMSLEDFADLTKCPADEIERYRGAGLLDPNNDGLFDDADVLRLQLIQTSGADVPLDQLAHEIRSSPEGRRLFGLEGTPTSPDEIAQEAGLDVEQLRTLGTILGFEPDEALDAEARQMLGMVGQMMAGGFPWEGVLEGARVYADGLRRLAENGMNMTHRFFCEPLEREGRDEREIALLFGQAGAAIGGAAEGLVLPMYRYFMRKAFIAHARVHLEPREAGAPPGSVRTTILFVDLALFSSLADMHGDEEAMRVIDRFDHNVREYSLKWDGRLVKQIGDEFMLVFRDAAGAVRFAIELHETMSRIERFVALRTGIHSGSVLYRIGDYYGHAVNVAARIASMAMPNAILVTEPVAKAAANEGIDVEEIGVRSLRGMEEPLPLYRVVSPGQ